MRQEQREEENIHKYQPSTLNMISHKSLMTHARSEKHNVDRYFSYSPFSRELPLSTQTMTGQPQWTGMQSKEKFLFYITTWPFKKYKTCLRILEQNEHTIECMSYLSCNFVYPLGLLTFFSTPLQFQNYHQMKCMLISLDVDKVANKLNEIINPIILSTKQDSRFTKQPSFMHKNLSRYLYVHLFHLHWQSTKSPGIFGLPTILVVPVLLKQTPFGVIHPIFSGKLCSFPESFNAHKLQLIIALRV